VTVSSGATSSCWPTVQLSEVAEHCLGKMLDAKKNKGRPLPYIANPNVRWLDVDTSNLKTMLFEEGEDERYGLRSGDVLICEGGEAGRAAIWDGRIPNVKFQKAIHRVRCGPKLDARYLVHRLMADYYTGALDDYYTGATIKHFTGQDLARYRFVLPPIVEQRRIAEILDKADALRAERRAAVTQLDELARSIFLDMFGDPVRDSFPENRVPFSELLQAIDSGWSPVCLDRPATESEWGVLKLGAVTWCEYDPSENKALRPDLQPRPQLEVQTGDLLFTRKNTHDLVAACALVRDTRPRLMMSDLIFRLRLRTNAPIHPVYLHQLLTFPTKRRAIQELAGGSAGSMPNISKVRLASVLIEVPPMDAQCVFAEAIGGIDQLRQQQRNSSGGLDLLFASLQHRAFRGEL